MLQPNFAAVARAELEASYTSWLRDNRDKIDPAVIEEYRRTGDIDSLWELYLADAG